VEIKCQLDATEATFIKSHPTNGIPDPQTETTKRYTAKKNLPRTPTRGPHNTRHTL